MKKISSVFAGLFLLFASFNAHVQSKAGAEYFTGKWNVLLKGLPDGDKKMVFVLENKNDSFTGAVQDTTGVEISKISNAELKDNEITLYFNAQRYDVYAKQNV